MERDWVIEKRQIEREREIGKRETLTKGIYLNVYEADNKRRINRMRDRQRDRYNI